MTTTTKKEGGMWKEGYNNYELARGVQGTVHHDEPGQDQPARENEVNGCGE